jgi:cytochrome c oxidase subunit 4
MSTSNAESIRKQTRSYLGVFAALMVLTVLTVLVAEYDLPIIWAVVVALAIATFKGSLVAGVFMHLSHERKVIYWVLGLTVLFFIMLMAIPSLWQWDLRVVK